jgi:hypothetical protein
MTRFLAIPEPGLTNDQAGKEKQSKEVFPNFVSTRQVTFCHKPLLFH